MALVDHWPFFGLRVRTPRIELRCPDDDLAGQLAELAAKGIHDPATMPFGRPWTDTPPGELERGCLLHYWRSRVELRPDRWEVDLAVLADGEVIGAGSIIAADFATCRTFETGSWLGRAFHGRGLGLEFRQACLHLGFAGLGAVEATTGAFHDNAPSLGVTGRLPYEPNGEQIHPRRDTADRLLKFRMPRAAWESVRRDDIEIVGLAPCLPLLQGDGGRTANGGS